MVTHGSSYDTYVVHIAFWQNFTTRNVDTFAKYADSVFLMKIL